MHPPLRFVLLVAFCFIETALAGAEPRYVVRSLVPDSLALISSAGIGINRQGDVVGSYWASAPWPKSSIFVYSTTRGYRDLGYPGEGIAIPGGINDYGQVALRESVAPEVSHVFRWSEAAGFQDLGGLSGSTYSEVVDINNAGQIVGTAEQADESNTAYVYTEGIGMQAVGAPAEIQGTAWSINDNGWITGNSNGWNAFIYRPGIGMTSIGSGIGTSINNSGVVAGTAGGPLGTVQAFVHRNGTNVLFGTLGGGNSDAYGINDYDVVVGWSEAPAPLPLTAFIWTEQEGMVALHSLIYSTSGWILNMARAINDSGQITGWGYFEGKSRAYRLDPIPPRLNIDRSATNLLVSWSPAWPGIVLESSSTLSPPEWQPRPMAREPW